MVNGEVGNYKIAYLKGKPDVLYSKMFDSVEAALDYGHKLTGRWLMFQRIGHEKQDYAWKLLPYGAYSSFKMGVRAEQAKWVIISALVLIAFYLTSKFLFKTSAKIY